MQIESNQLNTDTTKIKIQGINKEDTDEAKGDIEKIIEKRTNKENLKEKYTNTICYQFQRNQCRFGNQFWYKHPTDEKEIPTQPRSILRSPLQKRVKINDYRRPTTTDRKEGTSTFQHQTEYRNSSRSRSRSQTRTNTMENRQRYYEDARDQEGHCGEKDGLMKDRGTTTTVEKKHTDMKTATHQPMKIRDGANPRKEHMMKVKKGAADTTQAEAEDMNHLAHPHSGIAYTGSDY